ncbi:MAG: hypothetical protein IJU31_05485 [Synergistaceae bacterium]|nr:hypothetical protein [Synergistaceae bacterium]
MNSMIAAVIAATILALSAFELFATAAGFDGADGFGAATSFFFFLAAGEQSHSENHHRENEQNAEDNRKRYDTDVDCP